MFSTQIDAACIPPEGIVSEEDSTEIDSLIQKIARSDVSTLEVKCISNTETNFCIYGGVFEVTDYKFWKAFANVLEKGRHGGAVSQRALASQLFEVFKHPRIQRQIRGATPLTTDKALQLFFPAETAVRWRVGYTDWTLEHKVHGSVTLCPHSGDIALHFVPGVITDNSTQKNQEQMRCRLHKNLATKMDTLVEHVGSLTRAVEKLTIQIEKLQQKQETHPQTYALTRNST